MHIALVLSRIFINFIEFDLTLYPLKLPLKFNQNRLRNAIPILHNSTTHIWAVTSGIPHI